MSAVYKPMVSQETLLAMAQEKVCEDITKFGDFVAFVAILPNEVEHSQHFGAVSTDRLITEILLKERASDKQLADGMRELRRRFLAEFEPDVTKEFQRLLAEEWS